MEPVAGAVMEERKPGGHWYLLTGLIFGIAIGLVVSLLVYPVVNPEALPWELNEAGKQLYREQVALAYTGNPDAGRASSRLALLADADPVGELVGQAQDYVAVPGKEAAARALAELSVALTGSNP